MYISVTVHIYVKVTRRDHLFEPEPIVKNRDARVSKPSVLKIERIEKPAHVRIVFHA